MSHRHNDGRILSDLLVAAGIVCLLAQPASCGEETQRAAVPITFERFCEKVLAHYPRLKEQESSVEIAIAKKFQAQAAFMPRLQGVASMTTSDDQVYVFGALLRQRSFTQEDFALSRLNDPSSRTDYHAGLHAEAPLFDALQTIYKVKRAKHMVDAARYDLLFSRMEAILIATDVYYHAVAVEELWGVLKKTCGDSEEDVKQAEDLKNKGLVLGADFYAAKVVLGGLRAALNELEGQREGMRALLNILMGTDPADPLSLSDDFTSFDGQARDVRAWLSDAYEKRPDLLSLQETVRSQEAEISREEASALPTVQAFGDLDKHTQDFDKGGGSFSVGLKGSVDIFDAERLAKIRIAKEGLRKLILTREMARDSIAKDVTAEHARLGAFAANLPVMKGMAEDAGQAVDLMLPLYREGRKSIADLLEIRQGRIRAYQSYFDALVGVRTSTSRLLYLSGQLNEPGMAGTSDGKTP